MLSESFLRRLSALQRPSSTVVTPTYASPKRSVRTLIDNGGIPRGIFSPDHCKEEKIRFGKEISIEGNSLGKIYLSVYFFLFYLTFDQTCPILFNPYDSFNTRVEIINAYKVAVGTVGNGTEERVHVSFYWKHASRLEKLGREGKNTCMARSKNTRAEIINVSKHAVGKVGNGTEERMYGSFYSWKVRNGNEKHMYGSF